MKRISRFSLASPALHCRLALLLSCISISASAFGGEPDLEHAIASAANEVFKKSRAQGMVIAVVRDDKLIIQGLGETETGNGQVPNGRSLLRVGSISKVLAASLMVKLADEHALNLSDPLQKYAPAGYTVPTFNKAAPITLFNLATHTSGLARSVDSKAPEQALPFTWPDNATRWDWLQKQSPTLAPGATALYSNVAYDLLGDAISVAGAKPYDQLLREKLTAPLRMNDTSATPTAAQCARLLMNATAIAPAGPCADTHATASSGGMYSTAGDMGIWMRYLLGITHDESASERAVAQAVYVQRQSLASVSGLDQAGPASGVGVGWVFLAHAGNAPAILQKTGGAAGFTTYMALVPGRKVGIFFAATRIDFNSFSGVARSINELAALLAMR